MNNRRVTSPATIAQRISRRDSGNVWDYVAKINKLLADTPIKEDESIHMAFEFDVSDRMVGLITEVYEDEGWSVSITVLGAPQNGFPGQTSLVFTVP